MSAVADVNVSDLVGMPWVPGGRLVDGVLPLGGIDCWGVVVEVRRRAGLWSPDPWGCGPAPVDVHPEGLPAFFTRHMVTLAEAQPFCCVQLRSAWPGGHAGVLLPSGQVIETNRHAGVVALPLTRLRRRVVQFLEFVEEPAA